MTVKELIEELAKLPQDSLAMVSGYESGYDKVRKIENLDVRLLPPQAYYEGEYEEVNEDNEDEVAEAEIIHAVHIGTVRVGLPESMYQVNHLPQWGLIKEQKQ